MQATDVGIQDVDNAQLIQLAQDYMEHLQTGENSQAMEAFNALSELQSQQRESQESEQGLYQEVGKLTRELHESINDFMQDSRIQTMMSDDMPDARQRLNHVIELTEQSTHTTLTAVESSSSIISVLQQRASELQQNFNGHIKSDENSSALSGLAEELDAFLLFVSKDAKKVANDLNEILMAQTAQDLTGQVIQRVGMLVQEVEKNLLMLLQLGGEQVQKNGAENQSGFKRNNSGYGPAVPGAEKGDNVHSQEEVDDLLSSLGF